MAENGLHMKKVQLSTFRQGTIVDLFDLELEKVLLNIEDENTRPDEVRKITIELTIKPDKTRRSAETNIKAYSKLARTKPASTFMFFDHQNGKDLEAFEDDPGPELALQFPENKAVER